MPSLSSKPTVNTSVKSITLFDRKSDDTLTHKSTIPLVFPRVHLFPVNSDFLNFNLHPFITILSNNNLLDFGRTKNMWILSASDFNPTNNFVRI